MTRCIVVVLLCVGTSLVVPEAHAQGKAATMVGLPKEEGSSLGAALRSAGFAVHTAAAPPFSGQLVVLEARGPLSPETVDGLEAFVRNGGALLVGLDQHPDTAPVQLSAMLPTIAWITQAALLSRPLTFTPAKTGAVDAELFGAAGQQGFEVPYFFPLRPVSAVERGAERYDRYASEGSPKVFNHPAESSFWTRPVLNRDWRVRLSAADRAASPLLLTGRYGAGRVAVFASSLESTDPGEMAFWKPVLLWLTERTGAASETSSAEPAKAAVEVSSYRTLPDSLEVTLQNRTAGPLTVQLVARVLTWEEAFVRDVLSDVSLPANGSVVVKVPLPAAGPLEYQALSWRRAFVVRLGVLSASGATLLAEKRMPVDLSGAAGLELATDNLDRTTYPFASAPGVATLPGMQNHMGLPVMQYAYPPGSAVHASATLRNGVHNIAALARVTDETTPGNPSVVAINDEGARFNKGPRGGLQGYGTWNGKADADNALRFHFPFPVTVTAVTVIGSGSMPHGRLGRNPGAIQVVSDGKEIAAERDLDAKFVAADGVARVSFTPVKTTDLLVRLPWVKTGGQGSPRREAPSLGEVEIEGSEAGFSGELHGEAQLVLRDSLSGSEIVVARKMVSLGPGASEVWNQGFKLPASDRSFYQLQVRFAGETATVPILALQPKRTLTGILSERPMDVPAESFVTTKGFRNLFALGTGTRDENNAWETPDDLVFAYERRLKQVSSGAVFPTELFVNDTDLRHYSTPWTLFPNGENVFTLGTPGIVAGMKQQRSWAASEQVRLGFGDRWDSGPSLEAMAGWQELVAFDDYLQGKGHGRLQGRTHAELLADVNEHHASEWSLWQEQRYVATVEHLRTTFAADGKRLNMSGQGIPMATNADAAILSRTIRGMASDSTWGMEGESVPFTTGRQLGDLAFNPEWPLDFNLVWGYDSTTLDNGYWYGPVGTTEPSRRHNYDSAWRGIVGEDGQYRSSYTYGYGNNGGEAWTMAQNDYQQAWNAQERFSLLYPEHPVGAGLLVSSAPVDSTTSTLFSGGGMGPDGRSEALVHRVAIAFERLHNAGVSVPYTANIRAVSGWGAGSSFVLEDMTPVSDEEVASLKAMAGRGTRFVVFAGGTLNGAQAGLLGLNPDGSPRDAAVAGKVRELALLSHGNFLIVPLHADAMSPEMSLELAPMMEQWLRQSIVFPAGTMGYGFTSGRQTMVVLEDWKEEAREVTVRVRASAAQARAAGLNDHQSLAVTRDGADWVVRVPMRTGDGEVVVLEESGSMLTAQESVR